MGVNKYEYKLSTDYLQSLFVSSILKLLNEKSDNYQFERVMDIWNKNTEFNLSLEFDQFHATDSATVLVSGQYWFYQNIKI